MSYGTNDMQECSVEEYRRVYAKYRDELGVHSTYSGTIPGVGGWYTSWSLRWMKSQLIASYCRDYARKEDPTEWEYWVNADVLALMEKSEAASTPADCEKWEALREAAERVVDVHGDLHCTGSFLNLICALAALDAKEQGSV